MKGFFLKTNINSSEKKPNSANDTRNKTSETFDTSASSLFLGSHVSMKGEEMMLGSAKEAVSYNANTFMLYTGAPQNTRRKDIEQLRIPEALEYMHANHISHFVVHAPYIINLANAVNADTFSLAVSFLEKEILRTHAMGSDTLILHPGSSVGESSFVGIAQIVKGLNQVLNKDTPVKIALETMAGKGFEIGRSFQELAAIYDGVICNDKLRICFDTCHTHDAGYDIKNNFDSVLDELDSYIGRDQIAVFHINDSKNEIGAKKDRHENIGYGHIGFEALNAIVHHKDFTRIPKILETPYIPQMGDNKKTNPPYKREIEMFQQQTFLASPDRT